MSVVDLAKLTSDLCADEGFRLKVYDDATGKPIGPGSTLIGHPTIGIGRALDTQGVSGAEAAFLLTNNERSTIAALGHLLPWLSTLDEVRQRVLVEMAFNMGVAGLLGFHSMLASVQSADYERASTSMLLSQWAKEVPVRARKLALRMSSGED